MTIPIETQIYHVALHIEYANGVTQQYPDKNALTNGHENVAEHIEVMESVLKTLQAVRDIR